MSFSELQNKLASIPNIEALFEYFEVDVNRQFLVQHQIEIIKRFNGYLLLQKPQDWFEARRALRGAFCKIHRGQLDTHTRSACRGCTSCLRR
ncbi:nitrogen fixation protein NifW [Vibrio astriarenae]|uniref:Nitrogen fixation protein NifW n=1 Tax=Vibrio astriarenae TaxID=1481923 RepID=A0A7Z2YFW2_9VIBR|nr:nitrogenase-stabilizing/protective protein NifW [Vibrio astriarenae]QIA65942.1 nitrogen fixation protein NifW [Vibrio astriarenae]